MKTTTKLPKALYKITFPTISAPPCYSYDISIEGTHLKILNGFRKNEFKGGYSIYADDMDDFGPETIHHLNRCTFTVAYRENLVKVLYITNPNVVIEKETPDEYDWLDRSKDEAIIIRDEMSEIWNKENDRLLKQYALEHKNIVQRFKDFLKYLKNDFVHYMASI